MFVVLMASAIYIIGESLSVENEVSTGTTPTEYVESLPTESGVFQTEKRWPQGSSDNENRRTLQEYYKNRAYPGAPPVIPHAVLSETGIGGNSCLQCHQNGGYVKLFKAYAPISPHPDLVNCKQCHVPVKSSRLFKASNWEKISHPEIGGSVLPGSPPPIPHGLQMRENCLSCHDGPAVPQEIVVDHPLRINCRQCHAAKQHKIKIVWDSIPIRKTKIQWEELSQ